MLLFYVHLGGDQGRLLGGLLPILIFLGVFVLSNVPIVEQLVSPIGNSYPVYSIFWAAVVVVSVGIILVNDRVRTMLGLGPMGDDEASQRDQRRGHPSSGFEDSRTRASIVSRIRALPLEPFYSKEDLEKMSVSQLKRRASEIDSRRGRSSIHNNNKISIASLYDSSHILEKSELVQAILDVDCLDSSASTCIICCEDYQNGDMLRILACNHKFHVECVDGWFLSDSNHSGTRQTTICPICKDPL